ncbi:conjugal transfer protein TraH [Pectobacterium versatile]|uniref:conjugal transfer protein TraH n=1 Tax=Pectobacterium versatile TaxID=2488639 RepID=UPI001F46C04F|nr:conjugal transfer protein TraH [Pectobacterium versatile]
MKPTLLFILLSSLSIPVSAANWADKWFDNAVYDTPSSFDSQKRGYYTMGGFSARNNTSTDYPITISPPRLNVGCGGIDAFLGGFSFLDPDYLVEKAQRAMQAAPYVAFDMALKTMCKECADTLGKIEQITNFLNGIQLNECALAKPIATAALTQNAEALKGLWTEMTGTKSLDDATDRLWSESTGKIKSNNGNATQDLKSLIEGCPQEFKELMQHGSIVSRAAAKIGMSEFSDTIRGYMGDVWIEMKGSDKIPVAISISSCPQNSKYSLDDMLNGRSYIKTINKECVPAQSKPVRDVVYAKMEKILSKMKAAQELGTDEIKFINSTNIPVYSILRQAITSRQDTVYLNVLAELVGLNYSYYIFSDLYRNTQSSFDSINEMITTPMNAPNSGSKKCRMDLFAPAIDKFTDLIQQSRDNSIKVEATYSSRLQSYMNNANFIDTFRQEEARDQKNRAGNLVR